MQRINHSLFFIILSAIGLVACKNYGDKVTKDFVEVYYKDNITREQAQQTLDLLYPSWNEKGNTKSVQLTKRSDTVYFRMVINQEKAKDIKDEAYLLLANGISAEVFNGLPVNVDLTDNKFKTLRTLHFKKMETTAGYGPKTTAGNIEVYYKPGFTEKEATALAEFLDRLDTETNTTKSFQAGIGSDGVYVISMVSSPEYSSAVPEKEYYDMAALLSDSVFNGAALHLQLTDDTFQPFQTIRHRKQ